MTLSPIDTGNRIQLPADWMQALGLHDVVTLEKTEAGILIRPYPRTTWDDIFANKLVIGSAPQDQNKDEVELTDDDFLS
jgi:hypothetical protein